MEPRGLESGTRIDELLIRGTGELQNGDWGKARATFLDATQLEEIGPALEGLGAACWWLRDAEAAMDARRKAFRLYRDEGDRTSAARVAVSLVWDHMFRGERSIAGGWVGRAENLLKDMGPVEELGWLTIVKSHLALMVDRDPIASGRLAEEAVAIGKTVGNLDVEMLALAYEGFALVSGGRITEGMRKLDESSTAAMAGELENLNCTATVACCLIYACERVRDYGRAAEWCARLKEFCERWSFELMIAICRTHYASTLVSQGQWDDAQIELREAINTFGKTHPGQAAEALVRLADLRIRQGRLDEAAELLDEVQSGPARMMGHKIALAARSALLLERGDASAAVETAERYLRSIRDEESLERTSALEVILRAHILLGNEPEARYALARLRSLSDSVNTPPMRGAVLLAQGGLARAFGDPSAARTALEDASDIFEEVGMPLEAAQTRLLLAFCLHDAGGDQAAAGHARDALSAAQVLGATTLIDRARRLLEGLGQPPATAPTPFPGLTLRETEVLGLIARGLSNHDIATRLVLSVRTVERHISNIYLKLDLEGSAARAGATAAALQHGLV